MNEVTAVEDRIDSSDELQLLKNRAELMGIRFHPNIGLDTLKAKVNNALPDVETPSIPTTHIKNGKVQYLTHAEYIKQTTARARKNINRLVRVRVACMNPNKKEWEGEIISVGSAKIGTFKKFVPFNLEDGYHIPHIIYEAMKDRQYTSYTTVRGQRGEKIRKGKLVPEFNIEVLPPLTVEERRDLAQRQIMSGATIN